MSFWYQGRESKLVFGHINYEMPFRDAWPSRDAKQGGVGSISWEESIWSWEYPFGSHQCEGLI